MVKLSVLFSATIGLVFVDEMLIVLFQVHLLIIGSLSLTDIKLNIDEFEEFNDPSEAKTFQ